MLVSLLHLQGIHLVSTPSSYAYQLHLHLLCKVALAPSLHTSAHKYCMAVDIFRAPLSEIGRGWERMGERRAQMALTVRTQKPPPHLAPFCCRPVMNCLVIYSISRPLAGSQRRLIRAQASFSTTLITQSSGQLMR